MTKSIAIVGGGLMGALTALCLARKGHQVILYEREAEVLSRASRNNEGKVHSGFTYGLDLTHRTQDLMFRYGRAFMPRLREVLGAEVDAILLHRRNDYAVMRASQLQDEREAAHAGALNRIAADAGDGGAAFARRLDEAEVRGRFSDAVSHVHEVTEATVDVDLLCDLTANALQAVGKIEIVPGTDVEAISEEGEVHSNGRALGQFDRVLNAAWDGLPRLDAVRGQGADGYCLRAKCGFVARVVSGMPARPITFCWGPFGDLVPQRDGMVYISWYPACLMGFTKNGLAGAEWYDTVAAAFDFEGAYAESRAAFEALLPGLKLEAQPVSVKAGSILAEARTDIDDPASGLHRRHRFGPSGTGRVMSVYTAKLTCAPGLAHEIAEQF